MKVSVYFDGGGGQRGGGGMEVDVEVEGWDGMGWDEIRWD